MEYETIKLSEFAAWLRSLPADARFLEGQPSRTCPIAKYLDGPAAEFIGMPDWACRFMREFDAHGKSDIGAALSVLKIVEARFPALAK